MDFCIVVNEGQVLTLCLSPFQRYDVSSIRDQRVARLTGYRSRQTGWLCLCVSLVLFFICPYCQIYKHSSAKHKVYAQAYRNNFEDYLVKRD